ncbi:general odorant-binding protein 99a-like [Bradysia coprophila]|uniref:general odorant-binding protein 99a-like n=1 Tax=Bradysia coprophila TaxID=38358 RepID=UPI00187D738B|nr:general odorant-binding protein 99a-like [Bradysia coprophila]
MKYLIGLLLATSMITANDVWQPPTKLQMIQTHDKCLRKSNLPPLVLTVSEFWNLSDESSIRRIRDYVHCVLTTLHFFDDKSGFDVDRIMEQVTDIPYLKNTVIERSTIEKCADGNENNDVADVWAFRGFRCFMDVIKKRTNGMSGAGLR